MKVLSIIISLLLAVIAPLKEIKIESKMIEHHLATEVSEQFRDSEKKLLIFFRSNNCISCLFIIGRINREIIKTDRNFFAVGIIPSDDSANPQLLRNDSAIPFPIIKLDIDDELNQIFENKFTPLIILMNKEMIKIKSWVVYHDTDGKLQDNIIAELTHLLK